MAACVFHEPRAGFYGPSLDCEHRCLHLSSRQAHPQYLGQVKWRVRSGQLKRDQRISRWLGMMGDSRRVLWSHLKARLTDIATSAMAITRAAALPATAAICHARSSRFVIDEPPCR